MDALWVSIGGGGVHGVFMRAPGGADNELNAWRHGRGRRVDEEATRRMPRACDQCFCESLSTVDSLETGGKFSRKIPIPPK
jgi:hypothetical protein